MCNCGNGVKLAVLEYLSRKSDKCTTYDELRKLFVEHSNSPGSIYDAISNLVSDDFVQMRGCSLTEGA
jgi:DNA-binding PadR family transcriptional regulator